MVPVEVEMVVTARTAGIAECIAQAKFKAHPTDYIVANSYDDTSAHDWVPFVSPNVGADRPGRGPEQERIAVLCRDDGGIDQEKFVGEREAGAGKRSGGQ